MDVEFAADRRHHHGVGDPVDRAVRLRFFTFSLPGAAFTVADDLADPGLPNFLNMVALYLILQQLGQYVPWLSLNTHGGLILLYLGGVLGVNTWLMKGYFDSIPRDLDEAAMMDGAGHWQTFWRVIMPLVRPILVVVGLLSFVGAYSEYILARIMLTTVENYTLAVGLSLFIRDQYANRWGQFSAGALIGALPTVIIFLALQRYLVGGLTAGGVKG